MDGIPEGYIQVPCPDNRPGCAVLHTRKLDLSDPVDAKLVEWFEGRDSELGRFDPALLLEAVKTVSP